MKNEILLGFSAALALGVAACATQTEVAADAVTEQVAETVVAPDVDALVAANEAGTITEVNDETTAAGVEGSIMQVSDTKIVDATLANAPTDDAEDLAEGDANLDEGDVIETAEDAKTDDAPEAAPQN